jgi:hypothetical protein
MKMRKKFDLTIPSRWYVSRLSQVLRLRIYTLPIVFGVSKGIAASA